MLSKTWHSAALSTTSVRILASRGCPGDAPLYFGARDVPGAALFDFSDVELEKVVQPGDEFLSVHVLLSAPVRGVKPCLRGWAAA
jgi:hypothetical protein